jgi:hypothetical protein
MGLVSPVARALRRYIGGFWTRSYSQGSLPSVVA